jgi:BirA family biotin operon repressor/biotin-[acetyl-CoA-carboxylase] ligase
MLLLPENVAARDKFFISEAVALGIKDALHYYLHDCDIAIKWPNDIYVDDKKICGILIENTLSGNCIGRSIVGIGLNVNQTEFVSDAPNPISMKMLTDEEYDLDEVLGRIVTSILERLGQEKVERHVDYMDSLRYRAGANYVEAASGETFYATISDVATTGHLSLTDMEGNTRVYAFKEVTLVL